jgi:hypothetical protein
MRHHIRTHPDSSRTIPGAPVASNDALNALAIVPAGSLKCAVDGFERCHRRVDTSIQTMRYSGCNAHQSGGSGRENQIAPAARQSASARASGPSRQDSESFRPGRWP